MLTARPSKTALATRQTSHCTPSVFGAARLRKSFVVHYQVDAPDIQENVVNLECGGRTEQLTLINRKVHVKAIKEAFGLSTVKINGRIEPMDDDGFTLTKFSPQATLTITGQRSSEMASLFGEMAALRADIAKLVEMKSDIKDSGHIGSALKSVKDDLAAVKRLVAEVVAVGAVCHEPDKGPDFTKTSHDGYTFDTWWEAQCLARDIISGHTKAKPDSSMDTIHHEGHIVSSGMHAT